MCVVYTYKLKMKTWKNDIILFCPKGMFELLDVIIFECNRYKSRIYRAQYRSKTIFSSPEL